MYPEIFGVKSYLIFLILALAVASFGVWFIGVRRGFGKIRFALLVIFLSAVSLVGARLLHGFSNFGYYAEHPERWYALDAQGLSLFGGIITAIAAGAVAARITKIDLWKLGDAAVLPLAAGIAVMRIGCFLNGCCFGKETSLPWGVEFPILSPAHKYELAAGTTDFFSVNPVHPTQAYEMIAAVFGGFLAAWCLKKKMPEGTAITVFALWFAAFRFGNYFLRTPSPTFSAPAYFYPAFYGSLLFIGAIVMRNRLKIKNKLEKL